MKRDLGPRLGPFLHHPDRVTVKTHEMATKIQINKIAKSLHMETAHTKSKLHTWGNDSKRNPVANMTSRIISEAKQPAS